MGGITGIVMGTYSKGGEQLLLILGITVSVFLLSSAGIGGTAIILGGGPKEGSGIRSVELGHLYCVLHLRLQFCGKVCVILHVGFASGILHL